MRQNNGTSNFRPWIALAAATGINLTMGINYSWSVFKKALVTEWHWSNVDASLPYTTYTAIFALTMIFAGRLQDRFGPRLVATIGGIVLGTGLISCSFSHTPILMAITYGITGIGNALCFSTTIPSSVKWFPAERKGLITGIVVGGIGLAATYFAPIANSLLHHYDITRTLLILGVVTFIILTTIAQFLANPPVGFKPKSVSRELPVQTKEYASHDFGWREMIKTVTFRKLWLMYFFAASAGLMIMAHIATIAKTQANWENGFYLVIIFAIFNTLGRLVAGFFSDKYGRPNLMIIIFTLQAINLALFAHYTTPALLALGTALTGLAYGAAFALFPLATADFFGMKNFGGNYGLVFTAWGFAGIFGPVSAGWAIDLTGSYVMAYLTSAALLLVAILLAFTIRPTSNAA